MNRLIGGILTVIAIAILIGAAVATRFRPAENSNNLVESTTGSTSSPGTGVGQTNQGARSQGFNQPGTTGRTGTTGQTGTTGTTGQTRTTGTTGQTGTTGTTGATSQPATTGQPGTEVVPAANNPVGAGSKPPDSTGTTTNPTTPSAPGSGAIPARW